MPMPDQYYDSPLSGQQLDAAFQQMQGIEQTASRAQSNASAAAQSASQAASSASSASSSATRAGQSATQAQNSASAASSSASAAAESARQAADSAASIEGDAEAAAQSASNAQGHATAAAGSASAAAASASAAKDSEDAAETSAGTAQSASAAAAQSERNAKTSETNAASSASAAQQAASLIEDNLAAIQAAPSNAQAAQNAAAQAASSATAAEDAQQAAESSKTAAASSASAAAKSAEDAEAQAQAAAQSVSGVQPAIDALNQNMDAIVNAESNAQAASQSASAAAQSAQAAEDAAARAEQIADFNPADFATAAQGEKADTAVQPDELDAYALKTEVPTTPADIGAATADQGAKADTALQPGALDGYALKTDIPDELPNPQALTIQLGSSGLPTTYDGSTPQTLTVTPEAVGADSQPLTGNLDDVTPAQVRDALQAGRRVVLFDDGDVLTEWEIEENSFGTVTVKGSYSLEPIISSTKGYLLEISRYSGAPDASNTWSKSYQSVLVLPEVSKSDNGQVLIVQNGYWQPAEMNAAPQPLTGNLDDVTPAQVREAIQAGRQVSLLKDDNILSAWVDTGLNVQCLYGWNIGSYTGRSRAISLDGYYGDPNGDNTWNVEKLYGNVLPEVTTANNGKTVTVQNGQWQLGEASAGGGGEYTLIANTGFTSMNQGTSYNSTAAAQYDLLGIVCLCRGSTAADEYSQIQWFPVPESGQSRKYGLVCMNVAEVGSSGLMGEAQVRVVLIQNTGSGIKITSESQGYYYNWGNKGQDNTCAVPVLLYGMKF